MTKSGKAQAHEVGGQQPRTKLKQIPIFSI